MKIWKRAVSAALSLAMCVGMVSPVCVNAEEPSDVLSFTELQNAITTGGGVTDSRFNYEKEGETITITLNADVEYNGETDTSTKSITVSGEGVVVVLDAHGHTLDGKGESGSVIRVKDGASLTVKDATITGGTWSVTSSSQRAGGGILVENATFAIEGGRIVENGQIEGTKQTRYGGGIYVGKDADVTVTDTMIEDNKAQQGGGICNVSSSKGFVMNDGTICGNYASGYGTTIVGGGALFTQGNAELNNVTMENNSAAKWGGGIFADANVEIKLNSVEIKTNEVEDAEGKGGGIYIVGNMGNMSNGLATVEMVDTVVSGNKAKDGGGIYAEKAVINMKNSAAYDNTEYDLYGHLLNLTGDTSTTRVYDGGVYHFHGWTDGETEKGPDFEFSGYTGPTVKVTSLWHDLGELIPEVPATEEIEGTRAHYQCPDCDEQLLFDEAGNKVTEEELVVPVKPAAPAEASGSDGDGAAFLGAAVVLVGGAAALTYYYREVLPIWKLDGLVQWPDGMPVANAAVVLEKDGETVRTLTTDENGSFDVRVAKGTYQATVTWEKDGVTYSQQAELTAKALLEETEPQTIILLAVNAAA